MDEPRPGSGRKARRGLAAIAAACAAAAAGALVGCPSTTTTTSLYTPITGIQIPSSSLVAGRGCGQGADQVFRYAAVVRYEYEGGVPPGAPDGTWSDVFDCFADGYFDNLPVADDAGTQLFSVAVYAWSSAGFPADLAPCSSAPDGSSCPAQSPSAVAAAAVLHPPQWSTSCTATLQQGVPVLAVCGPLEASDAGSPAPASVADAGAPDGPQPTADASDAGDD